jgi:bifunctional non-homologous end joining protein LigD
MHSDNGELIYAGKVGTGFTQESPKRLRTRLDSLVQKSPPFSNLPAGSLRGIHWVRPELVAEIEFTGWTRDGLLRHPSFKGLRKDKSARNIKREYPQSTSPSSTASSRSGNSARVAGINLTHPDRILYPEQGITKRELAGFYEQIADWILPHLSGRPLVLVRCPEGHERGCFYQKHAKEDLPDSVRRISIQEQHAVGTYAMVDSLPALISWSRWESWSFTLGAREATGSNTQIA